MLQNRRRKLIKHYSDEIVAVLPPHYETGKAALLAAAKEFEKLARKDFRGYRLRLDFLGLAGGAKRSSRKAS